MQLVCGNTMKGVYSLGPIDTYIDVTGIPELTEIGQPGNCSASTCKCVLLLVAKQAGQSVMQFLPAVSVMTGLCTSRF